MIWLPPERCLAADKSACRSLSGICLFLESERGKITRNKLGKCALLHVNDINIRVLQIKTLTRIHNLVSARVFKDSLKELEGTCEILFLHNLKGCVWGLLAA